MDDKKTGGVRGQQSRTIDGRTYTTKPLPARKGLDILSRIIAYAGQDVITVLFAVPPEKRETALSNSMMIAKILTEFCENALRDREHVARPMDVIYEMMEMTSCDKIRLGDSEVEGNVQKHFDEHFKADYSHMMEVVQFIGEVNFAGP